MYYTFFVILYSMLKRNKLFLRNKAQLWATNPSKIPNTLLKSPSIAAGTLLNPQGIFSTLSQLRELSQIILTNCSPQSNAFSLRGKEKAGIQRRRKQKALEGSGRYVEEPSCPTHKDKRSCVQSGLAFSFPSPTADDCRGTLCRRELFSRAPACSSALTHAAALQTSHGDIILATAKW